MLLILNHTDCSNLSSEGNNKSTCHSDNKRCRIARQIFRRGNDARSLICSFFVSLMVQCLRFRAILEPHQLLEDETVAHIKRVLWSYDAGLKREHNLKSQVSALCCQQRRSHVCYTNQHHFNSRHHQADESINESRHLYNSPSLAGHRRPRGWDQRCWNWRSGMLCDQLMAHNPGLRSIQLHHGPHDTENRDPSPT